MSRDTLLGIFQLTLQPKIIFIVLRSLPSLDPLRSTESIVVALEAISVILPKQDIVLRPTLAEVDTWVHSFAYTYLR